MQQARGRPNAIRTIASALAIYACCSGAIGWAAGPSAPSVLALPAVQTWKGDFDGMRRRRLVRVLVVPGRTLFFQDRGELLGATAELGFELERWLNKRYGQKPYKIHVAFVPTRRDRILQDLRAGKGDIAAANLTITPERAGIADFVSPWVRNIDEVLVAGLSAPKVSALADLGGHAISARKSSSYYGHLLSASQDVVKGGGRSIDVVAADESLEDEDLLEMVSSGLLPWAVVDSHKAGLWAQILKNLHVHKEIAVHKGGAIAWAIRKDSPQLHKALNQFVAEQAKQSEAPDIWRRYFAEGKTVKNALARDEVAKFRSLIEYFRAFGKQYAIDPYLLAAQGYKESRLDQTLRVKSGAVGVMQIKPSTAREVGVQDVTARADNNIHAAAKYLRFLADKYVNDPKIDERNRVLMSLAAYNAGPGNLRKFRKYASDHDFDPNVWFGNVETGAAAIVGQETVRYIADIYKYYIAYSALGRDR